MEMCVCVCVCVCLIIYKLQPLQNENIKIDLNPVGIKNNYLQLIMLESTCIYIVDF